MNTLTVPKLKDLVNKPSEQYKDLFQTMQQGTQGSNNNNKNTASTETKNMTDELSSFLNDLKKTGTGTQNAMGLQNAMGMQNIMGPPNEIVDASQFSGNGFSAF